MQAVRLPCSLIYTQSELYLFCLGGRLSCKVLCETLVEYFLLFLLYRLSKFVRTALIETQPPLSYLIPRFGGTLDSD